MAKTIEMVRAWRNGVETETYVPANKVEYVIFVDNKPGRKNIYGQPLFGTSILYFGKSKKDAEKQLVEMLAGKCEYWNQIKKNLRNPRILPSGAVDCRPRDPRTGELMTYILCNNWREWYNEDGSLKPRANPTLRDAK